MRNKYHFTKEEECYMKLGSISTC